MRQQMRTSQFPYSVPKFVSLYVAQRRGCAVEQLDFIFGGSTLNFLATAEPLSDWERQNGPSRYACQVLHIPGQESRDGVLFVSKMNDYIANLNDPGYQFERVLSTNSGFGAQTQQAFRMACNEFMPFDKHEHLQVVHIGPYVVLMSADSDAVEMTSNGVAPVEIKCGNPRNFGMKVMWQMLSNGSQTLILANKRGRVNEIQTLFAAECRSFRAMVQEHSSFAIRRAESNIEAAMEKLRTWQQNRELEAGQVYELEFVGHGVEGMVLKPLFGRDAHVLSQLPPEHVLEQLLGCDA